MRGPARHAITRHAYFWIRAEIADPRATMRMEHYSDALLVSGADSFFGRCLVCVGRAALTRRAAFLRRT